MSWPLQLSCYYGQFSASGIDPYMHGPVEGRGWRHINTKISTEVGLPIFLGKEINQNPQVYCAYRR